MAKKASYLAASKGKKKCSYSMEIKKQFVVYAEANSSRCAASHFDRSRSVQENGRRTLKKLNLLNLTDSVLMEQK